MLEQFLRKLQFDSEIAEDGQQGVDAWKNGRFDLVLMDVSMPVLDGYEATIQIRAEEEKNGQSRCPIIGLTAHVSPEVGEACLEAGMDARYVKPFSLDEMKEVVARFVQGGSPAH